MSASDSSVKVVRLEKTHLRSKWSLGEATGDMLSTLENWKPLPLLAVHSDSKLCCVTSSVFSSLSKGQRVLLQPHYQKCLLVQRLCCAGTCSPAVQEAKVGRVVSLSNTTRLSLAAAATAAAAKTAGINWNSDSNFMNIVLFMPILG